MSDKLHKVERVTFFQQNVREQGAEPLEVAAVQALIYTYVPTALPFCSRSIRS